MGGEYKAFETYLKHEGISLRYSCPYTHHQNGKTERKHRHLVESGLTLLEILTRQPKRGGELGF